VAIVATETVAAVNRPVTAGTEGDLGFLATLRTGRRMHLPSLLKATATATTAAVSTSGVLLFAGCPAIGAAAGFIGKTLFSKEVLFGGTEGEVLIAVSTGQCLILVHGKTSSEIISYLLSSLSIFSAKYGQ
jgi:hypothetical protein